MSDALDEYVQPMLRAIVGLRIPADRLARKRKICQNRSAADRQGVAQGPALEAQSPQAAAMARLVPVDPAG